MVATERALATIEKAGAMAVQWAPDEIDVIKSVLCPGITDNELKLFAYQCQRTGLDPFTKQIHAIKRRSRNGDTLTIQIGIDGLRLIAERTGRYCPGRAPTFVHDEHGKLVSATAYVLKLANGSWLEVAATAFYDEYVQAYDGKPSGLWGKMPHGQTAKCAEALVLRKAFPNETSGAYADHELGQSDDTTAGNGSAPVIVRQEGPADLCDPATYQAKYFAIAEGTSYYEKPGRANFIFDISGGMTNSLTEYLATATLETAAKMIGTLKARVDAERATAEATFQTEPGDDGFTTVMDPDDDKPVIERDSDHDAAAEQRAEDRQAAKAKPADAPDFDPAIVQPWFANAVKAMGASGKIIVSWDVGRAIGDLLSSVLVSMGAGIDITRYLTGNPLQTYEGLTVAEEKQLRILANRPNAREKLMAVHALAVPWLAEQKATKTEAAVLG